MCIWKQGFARRCWNGSVSFRQSSGGTQKVEMGCCVLVFLWIYVIDKAGGALYHAMSSKLREELHQ